jgi:sortase A
MADTMAFAPTVAERTAPPPVTTEPPDKAPQGDKARGTRPGLLQWLSPVLLAVGIFTALFVVYELAFTGLTEQSAQASLLNQFQQSITTTTVDAPGASPAEGSAVALLEIPRIHLSQVVLEGTTPSDLKDGPGHLRNTPMPGEAGNVVIAGRRTTYGAPFGSLDQLSIGDTINVDTGQGAVTYVVSRVGHVNPGNADPVVATTDNRLTLITADPAFIASGRLVVEATLQGNPLDISQRRAVPVGTADLGLAGDPLGLAFGLIWGELLALTLWLAWRHRHRWSPEVLYLLTAPVALVLTVLTFSTLDLLLPGTL